MNMISLSSYIIWNLELRFIYMYVEESYSKNVVWNLTAVVKHAYLSTVIDTLHVLEWSGNSVSIKVNNMYLFLVLHLTTKRVHFKCSVI